MVVKFKDLGYSQAHDRLSFILDGDQKDLDIIEKEFNNKSLGGISFKAAPNALLITNSLVVTLDKVSSNPDLQVTRGTENRGTPITAGVEKFLDALKDTASNNNIGLEFSCLETQENLVPQQNQPGVFGAEITLTYSPHAPRNTLRTLSLEEDVVVWMSDQIDFATLDHWDLSQPSLDLPKGKTPMPKDVRAIFTHNLNNMTRTSAQNAINDGLDEIADEFEIMIPTKGSTQQQNP